MYQVDLINSTYPYDYEIQANINSDSIDPVVDLTVVFFIATRYGGTGC
jgi:hypothetical protein